MLTQTLLVELFRKSKSGKIFFEHTLNSSKLLGQNNLNESFPSGNQWTWKAVWRRTTLAELETKEWDRCDNKNVKILWPVLRSLSSLSSQTQYHFSLCETLSFPHISHVEIHVYWINIFPNCCCFTSSAPNYVFIAIGSAWAPHFFLLIPPPPMTSNVSIFHPPIAYHCIAFLLYHWFLFIPSLVNVEKHPM